MRHRPQRAKGGGSRQKATFYDLGSGIGNCSFPSAPANDQFVALGDVEYSGAAACGSYLDVSGPKGKVRVKVIDSCPPCEPGHIDLSRTAFKKIADEIDGIVPVTYKRVPNPAVPGPISVRLKEGSSRYWFAALIDNHANPLTSLKVSSGGGSFKTASRADYNYWIIDGGAGSGPFKIKITDVYGRMTTVSGIKLLPGTTQKTSSVGLPPGRRSWRPGPITGEKKGAGLAVTVGVSAGRASFRSRPRCRPSRPFPWPPRHRCRTRPAADAAAGRAVGKSSRLRPQGRASHMWISSRSSPGATRSAPGSRPTSRYPSRS